MGWTLVTGATGFVGRRVCHLLAAAEIPFVALARQGSRLDDLLRDLPAGALPRSAAEAVDLGSREQVADLGRRWRSLDRVVHLASPVPGPGPAATESLVAGGIATLNLLSLLDQVPVRHVTFVSSVAVYGFATDRPMDEHTPLGDCPTPYGLMKQLAERTLHWFARDRRLGLAVLRPSQIFGPGEPHGLGMTRMIRAAVVGQPLALHNGGNDQRDLVFVDDVARAVFLATEQEASGTFNISAGQGYSMKEVAEHIASAVGSDTAIELGPCSSPATRYVYPNDLARRQLGFQPATSLADGIRRTVACAIDQSRAAA